MKKISSVFIGVCSPLFYYFVVHFMLYCPWFEYNEKYAIIQNAMLFVLPALPGVAIAFLLVRNTLKEFFKSLGICFLISIFIIFIYNFIGIDLMIYTLITGYEEFSLGEGFLFAVTSISYIISCFVGTVVSGAITLRRQKRNATGLDLN